MTLHFASLAASFNFALYFPGGKKKETWADSVDHKASAHVATTTTQTDLSRGATFGVDWGVVTPRVSRRCASVEPVSPRHVTSSQ